MNKCNIPEKVREQITAKAGLVGLGVKVRQLGILKPIEDEVKIAQKTVKYTPHEKRTDALIAIVSGAAGLVEVNKRVRSDRALQLAFGRTGCAEQSVVQDTLDACTEKNVVQMQLAVDKILQQHSQVASHDYDKGYLLIEVDMTGRPCGRKAEFASKGYFAKPLGRACRDQRNRRGRQEGYVVASQYEEIVLKRIYDGATQLNTAFQPLMEATQQALNLTAEQRARTILRVDSGAGSVDDVNWALEQGGVEIEIKEDKQGFSMTKRNKKRFAAQQMVCLLEALAHNLLVWARQWLAPLCPNFARFGIMRMARDVLHITGMVTSDERRNIRKIVLNSADPFARHIYPGLAELLAREHVVVCLGEI